MAPAEHLRTIIWDKLYDISYNILFSLKTKTVVPG